MEWKGIELVEITEPGNIVFPKKMVVWDNIGLSSNKPCVRNVLALVKDNVGITRVIASQLDKDDAGVAIWNHCAEIPEEQNPRMVTNRKLSQWLAQGNGEVLTLMQMANGHSREMVETTWHYFSGVDNETVDYGFEVQRCKGVRKWDDAEWHEPDAQYMGMEEKQNEKEQNG